MRVRSFLLISLFLAAVMPQRSAADMPARSGPSANQLSFWTEFEQNPTIRQMFYDLFRLAGFGHGRHERAAFIIRNADGSYSCRLWPATRRYLSEVFRGKPPDRVVAIVHTHPNSVMRPSNEDIAESQRVGIPFYVVTMANIFRIVPAERAASPVVQGKIWSRNMRETKDPKCRCLEEAPEVPATVTASVVPSPREEEAIGGAAAVETEEAPATLRSWTTNQ